MNSHEDQCLIDGIAAGNSIVIEKIYKQYDMRTDTIIMVLKGLMTKRKF